MVNPTKNRLLVIVPCFNAGRHVRCVVEGVKRFVADVVVVDDGSTDQSFKEMKQVRGVTVLRHKRNLGKGAALKTGFSFALKHKFDVVITIDADGQHKPYDIPRFVSAIPKGDIIVGSRMHRARGMPLSRLVANSLSSFFVSLLCRQKIPDSQSGFRLIKARVLRSISLSHDDYLVETEMLVRAARKGFKIVTIPIATIYGTEVSHINPMRLTYRFVRFMLRSLRR